MNFILVTVFLDVLTFGLAIPVLPEMVKAFCDGDAGAASRWIGLLVSVFAAAQFLCAPILGCLSDRFGRRPVILLSVLGTGIDHLLLAFAPSIGWLFAGRVLAGLTASNLATVNAYVADTTPPEIRAKSFGRVGAAFGLGFIAGPALGGLLGDIDLRLPFLVAAGLATLNFCYGAFVLPESLNPRDRQRFSWRQASPIGSVHILRFNRTVLFLAILSVVMMIAFSVEQTLWVLSTAERFGWNTSHNGLSLALLGISSAIVQGALMPRLIRFFGEKRALLGALALNVCAFCLYGLAPSSLIFSSALLLQAVADIFRPLSQSVMTQAIPANQQGRLQGAVTCVNSLVLIGAPLFAAALFSFSSGPDALFSLPGTPFLVAAGLIATGIPLAWAALDGRPNPPPSGN